jgi:hypothetical protein
MTIGSIFLGLALLVLVGLFVARPLLTSEGQRKGRFTAREGLQAQKEEILSYIKALDFDFETGKLPEEDYQQQRDHYLTEGSAVLKKWPLRAAAPRKPTVALMTSRLRLRRRSPGGARGQRAPQKEKRPRLLRKRGW